MNDSRRLRNSSDEVRVELKDSGKPEKGYWNVDNERYSYSGHRDQTHVEAVKDTGDYERHVEYKSCGCRVGTACSCVKKPSKNQISIRFDLDETRQMTQDQKQTILNTLVSDGHEREEVSRTSGYRNLIPENGVIPLIALLAFFAFFSLILIAASGGHYYYY